MRPEDHINFTQSAIETWEEDFGKATDRQRDLLVRRLNSLLRQYPLDTFENGIIRPSGKNLATATKIFKLMQGTMWPKYLISGWSDTEKVITSLERANQKYFESLNIAFSDKPVYRSLISDSINVVQFTFNRDGRRDLLEKPIQDMLNTYVRQGGDLDGMVTVFERSLRNNAPVSSRIGQGVRQSFANYRRIPQQTTDSLFTLNRSYQTAVADSLGMDWFKYLGGRVKDTRDFCMDRLGGYYHRSEIEHWGKTERWDGRIKGTNEVNIFQRLGGYGCRHSLAPVTLAAVPNRWIERAISEGFYQRQ